MPTAIRASSGSRWWQGWSEGRLNCEETIRQPCAARSSYSCGPSPPWQIVRGLKIQPEARIGAKVASQPNRGIRGDVARTAHDLCQAVSRPRDGVSVNCVEES